ncbi:hypothetical protein [Bradyrhizobium sp. 2S1]|uniref:hypothetical protein n=1 Tax=Bradyrhizobium sp. 2S1 TaxID=1404429 RepID=UPI001407CB94|nr:hypothetical protein [Bradyrhizobium sp. 2S1]MCK7672192.1 hypothetical protein [Bradyrhizobium sp. 2S1]
MKRPPRFCIAKPKEPRTNSAAQLPCQSPGSPQGAGVRRSERLAIPRGLLKKGNRQNDYQKTHPADVADLALIPACKKFTATILKNNKPQTSEFDTLAGARLEAAKLNATANNSRKALVHAITAEGRAILVPALYGRTPADAGSEAAKADDKARDAKAAKPAKVARPAKAKSARKAKAKPAAKKAAKREGSKVEIVIAMLTGKKAVTRKDIAEATEWPSINIKAICARKGMKLKKAADGTLSASAPK